MSEHIAMVYIMNKLGREQVDSKSRLIKKHQKLVKKVFEGAVNQNYKYTRSNSRVK